MSGETCIAGTGATHEVFNQSPALENFNSYDADQPLQEAVLSYDAAAFEESIRQHGLRCGSAESIAWGFLANRYGPVLETHDRTGVRQDLVHYHPAYHSLMKMALSHGLHATPWLEPGRGAHVARAAAYYLQAQVEAGHGCPVTMTFASVPALRQSPELSEHWLPKVLTCIYDPRNIPASQKRALTIGMGMTEKQGGSDVRANTTRATALGHMAEGDAYELTGHKWFLSAPMCDGFLMLAQTAEGPGCFLVPRWRPDGTKNPLELQRLKDKMGNVANASSEAELRGALGWRIGAAGRGIPTIIEMVAMTRFDCMIGSLAAQRQAVVQATHHAAHRHAFGKPLLQQALMQNVLADLHLEVEGALALTFRIAHALDQPADEDARNLVRLGAAVGKYWICKRGPQHAYEAMECLGGNGVNEAFISARLYRDAPINAIWEGSGNIQALDVLRAINKTPQVLDSWLATFDAVPGRFAVLDRAVVQLRRALADPADAEYRARWLIAQLALTMQAALLAQSGDPLVADAFIRSRLGGDGQHHFGCLPRGIDCRHILKRAGPWVDF
ncbi:acyl-CoA dehydrogenase family protein [Granulosicoccaceae sp. 1_MG-2023]|nr:acyl-CoA dehydrogenase family protein [Granulosicoccaceae sp. 1_MG-2023]